MQRKLEAKKKQSKIIIQEVCDNRSTPLESLPSTAIINNRRTRSGRKKVIGQIVVCYRENKSLKKETMKKDRIIWRLMKRNERLEKMIKENRTILNHPKPKLINC
mgnify:CR=1 FL=1